MGRVARSWVHRGHASVPGGSQNAAPGFPGHAQRITDRGIGIELRAGES